MYVVRQQLFPLPPPPKSLWRWSVCELWTVCRLSSPRKCNVVNGVYGMHRRLLWLVFLLRCWQHMWSSVLALIAWLAGCLCSSTTLHWARYVVFCHNSQPLIDHLGNYPAIAISFAFPAFVPFASTTNTYFPANQGNKFELNPWMNGNSDWTGIQTQGNLPNTFFYLSLWNFNLFTC